AVEREGRDTVGAIDQQHGLRHGEARSTCRVAVSAARRHAPEAHTLRSARPTYAAAGRIRRLSPTCSRRWAVPPPSRAMANLRGESPRGRPAAPSGPAAPNPKAG